MRYLCSCRGWRRGSCRIEGRSWILQERSASTTGKVSRLELLSPRGNDCRRRRSLLSAAQEGHASPRPRPRRGHHPHCRAASPPLRALRRSCSAGSCQGLQSPLCHFARLYRLDLIGRGDRLDEEVQAPSRRRRTCRRAVLWSRWRARRSAPRNAAWAILNVIAHNLGRYLGRIGLGRDAPTMTTKTLRTRLLSLPGRMTTSGGRTTLHLPKDWPWAESFRGCSPSCDPFLSRASACALEPWMMTASPPPPPRQRTNVLVILYSTRPAATVKVPVRSLDGGSGAHHLRHDESRRMATLSPLLLPRLSSQHNTCHIGGAGKLKTAGDFSQRASIREYAHRRRETTDPRPPSDREC